MELIVSNPNLHPVWAKILGIAPQARPATTTAIHPSPLVAAIAAMAGQKHGWQPTHQPHRPGAPVGIKKQLGPGLWVSTVATPGDSRYPTHS